MMKTRSRLALSLLLGFSVLGTMYIGMQMVRDAADRQRLTELAEQQRQREKASAKSLPAVPENATKFAPSYRGRKQN